MSQSTILVEASQKNCKDSGDGRSQASIMSKSTCAASQMTAYTPNQMSSLIMSNSFTQMSQMSQATTVKRDQLARPELTHRALMVKHDLNRQKEEKIVLKGFQQCVTAMQITCLYDKRVIDFIKSEQDQNFAKRLLLDQCFYEVTKYHVYEDLPQDLDVVKLKLETKNRRRANFPQGGTWISEDDLRSLKKLQKLQS